MNDYRGFRSTKFVLVAASLLLGTAMLLMGKITGDLWTWGVLGLVASYITGDVGSRFAAKGKPE